MELSLPIVEDLYARVKEKFTQDMEARDVVVPKKNKKSFWHVTYQEQELFRTLIGDFSPTFLLQKAEYNTDRRHEVKGKSVVSVQDTNYLLAFLTYLEFPGEGLDEKFASYLDVVKEAEAEFQRKYLNQRPFKKERAKPREDIEDLVVEAGRLYSKRYSPRLLGEKFWFFFYGYEKFKGVESEDSTTWPLVKLLFRFDGELTGIDIGVEIDNTGDTEHHDYVGKTDFLTSREEVLVINARTNPDYTRQLNIKINIGSGSGSMFLGQYMNYESEGRIISGSLLMLRIPHDETDLIPQVHRIPKLTEGQTRYLEDFDGINRNILQYLHDKKQNIRRTSLRAGHSLHTLEKWLDHHQRRNGSSDN